MDKKERAAEAIVGPIGRAHGGYQRLATKSDLNELASFSEKLRVQGWALMGGLAALITIYTALIKLLP